MITYKKKPVKIFKAKIKCLKTSKEKKEKKKKKKKKLMRIKRQGGNDNI